MIWIYLLIDDYMKNKDTNSVIYSYRISSVCNSNCNSSRSSDKMSISINQNLNIVMLSSM